VVAETNHGIEDKSRLSCRPMHDSYDFNKIA
jgi:hypothetical protein